MTWFETIHTAHQIRNRPGHRGHARGRIGNDGLLLF